MDQVERFIASWASGPNRNASNKSLALVSGAKGAEGRSHRLMEEKTGGAVSRDGIWLHESVDVVRARRLMRVLRAVSGRSGDTFRCVCPAEPWDLKRMQSGSSRYTDSQLEVQDGSSHCIPLKRPWCRPRLAKV